MKNFWDAITYSQFLALRTRPARDLLAAIPNTFHPKTAYDLGCGPGNSTILLKDRWPDAAVVGVDSSPSMLEQARSTYPTIHFIESDIATLTLEEKVDCLFANASLQWLPQHELHIPRLLQLLRPGGVFAFQLPNNFHAPSHQIAIQILQANPTWRGLLKNLPYGALAKPLYQLTWYYDLLSKTNATSLQLWETEYFQELPGIQAIFDWVKGTGLGPVLSAMDNEQQQQFIPIYMEKIAKAYPLQANRKVLLPYQRIFMVGFIT
jgi:trans-aconitate 2-methyltransferase